MTAHVPGSSSFCPLNLDALYYNMRVGALLQAHSLFSSFQICAVQNPIKERDTVVRKKSSGPLVVHQYKYYPTLGERQLRLAVQAPPQEVPDPTFQEE